MKHDGNGPRASCGRGRYGRILLSAGLLCAVALPAGERLLSWCLPFPKDRWDRFGASRVVLDRRGALLRVTPTPLGEKRIPIPLDRVSPHLVHAVLAAEDERFFSHGGVDLLAAARAAMSNLLHGRIVSGASTLTMQAARLVEPGGPRLVRKVRELFRARQMERERSKEEILAFYLNHVPLGGVLRGVEAGALYWFGKHAADLAPQEAAVLAALLPAPTRRRPDRRPGLLVHCRNHVLDRMRACGYLDGTAWARARNVPLGAAPHPWPWQAPHACDLALRETRARVVRTGLDLDLQLRVEGAVRAFEGPAVDGLAVVVLDRHTGEIRALVGSRDHRRQPLNAALCARPTGSTLKPFLYALAFDQGIVGPESLLADAPLRIGDYVPANFDRAFRGAIRAESALVQSRNLPALRLLRSVGVEPFRDLLGALDLHPRAQALYLDLALGTESFSPLAMARAWQRFGDPAWKGPLSWKTRKAVLDALSAAPPDPTLLAPGSAAWKTGTSANRRDAWTVGSTEGYVFSVWLGNLDGRPDPRLVGIRAAAPLFARVAAALEETG